MVLPWAGAVLVVVILAAGCRGDEPVPESAVAEFVSWCELAPSVHVRGIQGVIWRSGEGTDQQVVECRCIFERMRMRARVSSEDWVLEGVGFTEAGRRSLDEFSVEFGELLIESAEACEGA